MKLKFKMKKLTFILALLIIFGCDKFLDIEPQDTLTTNSFYQTKDDALAALDGNFGEMFGFDDIADDDEPINIFNDPAACVGCAE